MMIHHKIIIKNGNIKFIYDDDMHAFLCLGSAKIVRASHVEPINGIEWEVDLSPVGGPIIGPFNKRQIAINQEVEWLNANNLG